MTPSRLSTEEAKCMWNAVNGIPSVYTTWLEVDLDALTHNYRTIEERVRPAEVIPVVKANAEGLGARLVSRALEGAGAKTLAVSHFVEALDLRRHGVRAEILVMNGLSPDQMAIAVAQGFQFFVFDEESLRNAVAAAALANATAKVHVKVETGLGRLGLLLADAPTLQEMISSLAGVKVVGVATHLQCPDASENDDDTRLQFRLFEQAARVFDPQHKTKWHVAASSATLRFPDMYLDAVRVGKLCWGITNHEPVEWGLHPVGSYHTRLVQVKDLPAGSNVGYNMHRVLERDTRVGIIPMGVVDGFLSTHGDSGLVLVEGKRCPVLAVCSCESMLDVTDTAALAGDEVTLYGRQGNEYMSITEFAGYAGSGYGNVARKISYRIPRLYRQGGRLVAGEIMGERIDRVPLDE